MVAKNKLHPTTTKSHLFDQKFLYLQKGFRRVRQEKIYVIELKASDINAIVWPKAMFPKCIPKYQKKVKEIIPEIMDTVIMRKNGNMI